MANKRFKEYFGMGWVFFHSNGVSSYPDSILEIEYIVKEGHVVSEGDDLYDNIVASFEEHDLEDLSEISSIRRFSGLFISFNLGSSWTGWGYGDSREEALEMLDDQYGIFDHLF